MLTAIPWFFLLVVVLMGGFTLLCLVLVLIRISRGGSGGVPPRGAAGFDNPAPGFGATPPVIPDDQLTNPANPLYRLHYPDTTANEPHRHQPHDPGPSPSAFDAAGGGSTFDSGGAGSSSFDSGSGSTGSDSSGSNCG